MQFVGRMISSVSEIYGSINPSNLSGAIDILVVEDKETEELRSSPFHVRFGKGQVLLRPQDRKVDLIVNGNKISDIEMRIGEAGEAYFVEPLEESEADKVPERFLSTSPNEQSVGVSLKALSDNEMISKEGEELVSVKSTGHLSDSEVTYSPQLPSPTLTYEKSPDWDWQWGDLPVHKTHESQADVKEVSSSYFDIIAYLQTARNIEKVCKQLKSYLEEGESKWSVKLYQMNVPFRVYPIRDFRRNFEQIIEENTDRVLKYEAYSADMMKLLDNSLLSRLVCQLTPSEGGRSLYLSGKAGLHTSIAISLFREAPDLSALLKLAEELIEEELPVITAPSRSWRSWWSRSPASPIVHVIAPASPTIPAPSSPVPISVLAPESPMKEPPIRKPKYLKSLRLPSEKLKLLKLLPGENTIIFSVGEGEKSAFCASKIYLWNSDVKIVISDIDGTITKSDALGHFFAIVGKDWTHSGVASLYDAISKNGYKFLYLTSRSIGQSSATQKYIRSLEQDKNKLPDGPIIMSPERLFAALKREVIVGNPEEFKIAALKDVQKLFYPEDNSPTQMTPFYAGFGNRITDAQSYHAVGVPPSRIFTVNASGAVWVEQLVLVGGATSSYLAMTDIVDMYFPPVQSAPKAEDEGFSELAFWKPQRPSLEQLVPSLGLMKAVVGVGDELFLIEGEEGSTSAPDSQFEEEEESVTPLPYI